MKVTDKITITNEDNMLLMARYPDNYFDLAIVDPPYGIGGDKGIQKNKGKFGFKKHKNTNWDDSIPLKEYFDELFRVSKNQIIWGGNYFTYFLSPKMCWLSWFKSQTNFSFSDFELAWTSFNTKCRQFELIRGFDEKGKHYSQDNSRIHPTQKPTALYKFCLEHYAKEGDKILDTHLGSGSIAIACHDYGFELTACELDKEYYDKAIQRIVNHTNQTKLF
jgi:site-specific DNA-methyltransferase (adenine-specific)